MTQDEPVRTAIESADDPAKMEKDMDELIGLPLEVFDWGLYSALIRKERKDKGYRTADAFSATVYRRTRLDISRDSVYKIEQGKQVPDAVQFMAINISLYGEPFPARILEFCFCPEWKELLSSGGRIPTKWAEENFAAVAGDEAKDPWLKDEDIARRAGDEEFLFSNANYGNYSSLDEDIPF